MQSKPLFNPDFTRALAFARACPRYQPTPLHTIDVDGQPVWVKDESLRFGLGSFKALGGIYAVAQLLLNELEARDGQRPAVEDALSESVQAFAKSQTYVCASAGNHGLAVATGAKLFGAKARIYVASTVPDDFAHRLRGQGAEVCVSGDNYEESLEAANADVEQTGAILLADGSWPGYIQPPSLVMEGYTVMALEMAEVFEQLGEWPSDVYLQAGVGGLAAAVTYMIRHTWPVQPKITIVEPTAAQCLAVSAGAGELTAATGPVSSMGRLDCKEASMLAFDTLSRSDVEYRAITDEEAAEAVAALSSHNLHTTPSGGAGFYVLQQDKQHNRLAGSRPLMIMSEQAIS